MQATKKTKKYESPIESETQSGIESEEIVSSDGEPEVAINTNEGFVESKESEESEESSSESEESEDSSSDSKSSSGSGSHEETGVVVAV
jgi:hypothetical protein